MSFVRAIVAEIAWDSRTDEKREKTKEWGGGIYTGCPSIDSTAGCDRTRENKSNVWIKFFSFEALDFLSVCLAMSWLDVSGYKIYFFVVI